MDDFQQLLLETFAEEARETVQALEKALIGLERSSNDDERKDNFQVLARRAHNLKGAAGAAGVAEVQELSHALEDGLIELRESRELPRPEHFDLLYAGIDAIRQLAVDSEATPPDDDTLDALKEALRDMMAASRSVSRTQLKAVSPEALQESAHQDEPAPTATAEADESFVQYELTPTGPMPADTLPPGFSAQQDEEEVEEDDDGDTEILEDEDLVVEPPPPAQPQPAPVPEPPPVYARAEPRPQSQPKPKAKKRRKAPRRRTISEEKPAVEETVSRSSEAPIQTVRVSVEKLDALMNQIGEILTIRKKTEARLTEMEGLASGLSNLFRQFQALHTLSERTLAELRGERAETLSESFSGMNEMLSQLETQFYSFHRQATHDAITEGILTERLPEDIKRLRMRPFNTLEDTFHRTVLDAARQTRKKVRLELVGMDTEADQGVLDAVRDPMMHLLRNCVDHGIERTEERVAAGKSEEGKITIRVEGRSSTMLIYVSDDGAGIDPDALRRRVHDRNLMPASVLQKMSDREVLDLIFLPGFSTATSVGMISGRGIGMDVVRQIAQQHHGSVTVDTVLGEGTTFMLELPLSFATVQGIIIKVLGHEFALPIYAVDRLVRLSRNDIVYVEGSPTVMIDEAPLSLVSLSELLEVPPNLDEVSAESDEWEADEAEGGREALLNAAIVKSGDLRIALIVDEFVGDSEMVVKDLKDVLGNVRNVAGATVTWSGEVMVILNPIQLVESALSRTGMLKPSHTWLTEKPRQRRILVCDDSLTTRTLEKNILVAAGYEVEAATHGLEALRMIERSEFQLIVLDVDMPELNGFELTRRLRAIKAYREVPIILVTSRDSEEDKRKGLSSGADAYITKQSFTQRTFLETVRRFLE